MLTLAALLLQSAISQPLPQPRPRLSPEPISSAHGPGVIGAAAGSGKWPAVAEVVANLPGHTLYHPVTLADSAPPDGLLPIILWGNGSCRDNGLSAAPFLREVASHGYFVVAVGHARFEPKISTEPPALLPVPDKPVALSGPGPARPETTTADMLAGLDWALAQNTRSDSRWYGRLDSRQVAVMGYSCGGLQAIEAAADPRVRTAIIWSSGIYDARQTTGRKPLAIDKSAIARFHTPVAYINGGPADIAYRGAASDFALIQNVPAFFAWTSIGHGGTFHMVNGGVFGKIGVAWLDWQLKGNVAAGRLFTGSDCGLCTAPDWHVRKKGID